MVFVKVDPVVMLTTSLTATSGMLAMLSHASVSVGHVPTHLPSLLATSRH
jgi:hypothetical protein